MQKKSGFLAIKKKGTILYRWIDIAKIDVPRRDSDPLLKFKIAEMEKYGFDKEQVKTEFENFTQSRA
eukprot:12423147-Karenia_brevis.AAC.1